nr:MAG TPA: hypothetical protein [Bacteriophage sp.]
MRKFFEKITKKIDAVFQKRYLIPNDIRQYPPNFLLIYRKEGGGTRERRP